MLFKKVGATRNTRDFQMNSSNKFHVKLSGAKFRGLNRSSQKIRKDAIENSVASLPMTTRGFTYRKKEQDQDFKLTSLNSERLFMVKKMKRNRFFQEAENRKKKQKQNESVYSKCEINIIGESQASQRDFITTLKSSKFCRKQNKFKFQVSDIGDLIKFLKSKAFDQPCSYSFMPSNITMDYCLTQFPMDGSFLNGHQISITPLYSIPQIKINLSSFNILKCIGTGGFAKVYLCRFLEDQNFYAMKVVEKEQIIRRKKQHILINELEVMKKLRGHPFIVDLKFSFETENYIVFITEFCPGSEFFNAIKKFKRMSEEQAKFYSIEILLGIQHVHQNQILYRDIKPQNILLDLNGHIKITDFGLSKPVDSKTKWRAYSFCGSPEYMSPEIIVKGGHGYASDFYSFGALLFEMLTGLPPFYSHNPDKIYEGTLSQELRFPKQVKISTEGLSLMRGLLEKDEKMRLGSYLGTKQILAHPWFGKINRSDYLNKIVKPPLTFNSAEKIDFSFKDYECQSHNIPNLQNQPQITKRRLKNFYYDSREPLNVNERTNSSGKKKNLTSESYHLGEKQNCPLSFRQKSANEDNLTKQIRRAFIPQSRKLNTPQLASKIMSLDKKYFQ